MAYAFCCLGVALAASPPATGGSYQALFDSLPGQLEGRLAEHAKNQQAGLEASLRDQEQSQKRFGGNSEAQARFDSPRGEAEGRMADHAKIQGAGLEASLRDQERSQKSFEGISEAQDAKFRVHDKHQRDEDAEEKKWAELQKNRSAAIQNEYHERYQNNHETKPAIPAIDFQKLEDEKEKKERDRDADIKRKQADWDQKQKDAQLRYDKTTQEREQASLDRDQAQMKNSQKIDDERTRKNEKRDVDWTLRPVPPQPSVSDRPISKHIPEETPESCAENPEKFLCKNHRCILAVFKCDGQDNCGDNSDEVDSLCAPKCSPENKKGTRKCKCGTVEAVCDPALCQKQEGEEFVCLQKAPKCEAKSSDMCECDDKKICEPTLCLAEDPKDKSKGKKICLPDPCGASGEEKCSNGGKCHANEDKKDFTCECFGGYIGTLCEENPCLSENGLFCSNNGKCLVDEANNAVCKCHPGFTGPVCDQGIARGITSLKWNWLRHEYDKFKFLMVILYDVLGALKQSDAIGVTAERIQPSTGNTFTLAVEEGETEYRRNGSCKPRRQSLNPNVDQSQYQFADDLECALEIVTEYLYPDIASDMRKQRDSNPKKLAAQPAYGARSWCHEPRVRTEQNVTWRRFYTDNYQQKDKDQKYLKEIKWARSAYVYLCDTIMLNLYDDQGAAKPATSSRKDQLNILEGSRSFIEKLVVIDRARKEDFGFK